MKNILAPVILCGYERGGTTLLSEILAQNGYQSGFECGVLMCKTPREFINFNPYFHEFPNWWKIPKNDIDDIVNTDSHLEFYSKAIEKSGCFKINQFDVLKFFDKTPIYMSQLGFVMSNLNFSSKVIVIHRDPRSVFVSWAKRRKNSSQTVEQDILSNINTLSKRYLNYFSGSIFHKGRRNVLFVSFEQLCLDIENHLSIIGHFLDGHRFNNIEGPVRYNNVTSSKIDQSKIFEYTKYISKDTGDLILENNKLASDFFANLDERVKYGKWFAEIEEAIMSLLGMFDIKDKYVEIDGVFFDAPRYLFRYNDVLDARVNPIKHWQSNGKREGRLPH